MRSVYIRIFNFFWRLKNQRKVDAAKIAALEERIQIMGCTLNKREAEIRLLKGNK